MSDTEQFNYYDAYENGRESRQEKIEALEYQPERNNHKEGEDVR